MTADEHIQEADRLLATASGGPGRAYIDDYLISLANAHAAVAQAMYQRPATDVQLAPGPSGVPRAAETV